MKYINLLLAIIFINPIIGFAQNCEPLSACDPFQASFYGGIRIAPSVIHSSTAIFSEILELPDITSSTHSKKSKVFGSAGLQFGYLYRCMSNPLVIAPEIFLTYNPSSTRHKIGDEPYSFKTKTSFTVGGNVRIGVLLINNLFLYGFAGITHSAFRFHVHDDTNDTHNASQSKYGTAPIYGLGCEYEFQNTNRIRLEFGYSHYNPIKFSTISHDKLTYHSLRLKPKIYSINFIYSIPFN